MAHKTDLEFKFHEIKTKKNTSIVGVSKAQVKCNFFSEIREFARAFWLIWC